MRSEAGFGTAAVRYASVGAGFRGPRGPPTVGEPATDGHGPAHGRPRTSPRTRAGKATDAAGGSGYSDRPPGFSPLTWHFRMPEHLSSSPSSPDLGSLACLAYLAGSAALPSVYRQSHNMVD